MQSGKREYQVIVPTRESARWIGSMLDAYRTLGIEPLFLYDARSTDNTFALLRAMKADCISLEPEFDRVESMLSAVRDVVDQEWVVRFDDDELPSAALIEWLDTSLRHIKEDAIALSCRNAQFVEERLCFARLEDFYFHPVDLTYLCPAWRAFRPRKVEFTDAVHTPGFRISQFATAPSSAFFVHFDWTLRTVEQRLEKVRRYERQSPGGGWPLAQFYLPELHVQEDLRWTPFETAEFDHLAQQLLTRAPALRLGAEGP